MCVCACEYMHVCSVHQSANQGKTMRMKSFFPLVVLDTSTQCIHMDRCQVGFWEMVNIPHEMPTRTTGKHVGSFEDRDYPPHCQHLPVTNCQLHITITRYYRLSVARCHRLSVARCYRSPQVE